MNYQGQTKDELIKELQKLQQEYDSLKTSYEIDINELKQIDEAFHLSEERYRNLFETASDSIFIIDPTTNNFLNANPAASRLYGYSNKEFLRLRARDISAEPEKTEAAIRDEITQIPLRFHHRKDGSIFPVEIMGSYFKLGDRRLYTAYIRDISKRMQTEEALQMEKENFRHSLDDSPLGVRIATIEGNTIYANKTLLEIYGYHSLEELQKAPLKNRYTPESYVEAQKRKHQREHGDFSATDYEISIIRKNGEIRHLQVFRKEVIWSGVNQFQVIYHDITEQKLAEKGLRENEEIFRIVISNAPISIFVTDDKGVIILHEGKVLKKLGMRSGENVGVSAYDLFNELRVVELNGKVTNGKSVLNRVFKGEVVSGITELNGMHFDNQFVPFFGINDEVIGFIGVATDITSSKKIEEELRKSKEMLEKLNQHLNEIREDERALISREIHDELGQSLTALKLDLYHMYKYVKVDQEAQIRLSNMVELVSGTIKNVQRISSDLRPGILDDLGLVSAVEWYCNEFEERSGIKCSLKLDNSDYNDSQINLVIFRVLQETLTNVLRHASASFVKVNLRKSYKGITMTIHDNGVGIPEEKINSNKSLGLISIRERVKQFNGKIDISSIKGNGTKLIVFMPS